MTFTLFVTAVVGALILQRQQARHRYELRRECERLGWDAPPPGPELSDLESWVSILLGAMLTALAGAFINAALVTPFGLIDAGWIELIAVILASGLTLLWLGGRGWLENRRDHRTEPRSSPPPH
jgi:hypothetical protein